MSIEVCVKSGVFKISFLAKGTGDPDWVPIGTYRRRLNGNARFVNQDYDVSLVFHQESFIDEQSVLKARGELIFQPARAELNAREYTFAQGDSGAIEFLEKGELAARLSTLEYFRGTIEGMAKLQLYGEEFRVPPPGSQWGFWEAFKTGIRPPYARLLGVGSAGFFALPVYYGFLMAAYEIAQGFNQPSSASISN